jgi:spermidine synthase
MEGWTELAQAVTAAGDRLVLRAAGGVVELRCNGWDLMSNRAHGSEEALARFGCAGLAAQAGTPQVLIGGLGLGYTLRAALDLLPAGATVLVAELLPEVVAWNRGVLAGFARRPLDDPRVRLACTDIAALLRDTPPTRFDAILLDTDNGPDAVMLAANAALYDPAGLRLLAGALRPGGTLAVWSADRSPRFEAVLDRAGLDWTVHDVPARGARGDPLHSIYRARRSV